MTALPWRNDPDPAEAAARVTGHTPEGGVIVEATVVCRTGGGPPGDSGRLGWGRIGP